MYLSPTIEGVIIQSSSGCPPHYEDSHSYLQPLSAFSFRVSVQRPHSIRLFAQTLSVPSFQSAIKTHRYARGKDAVLLPSVVSGSC